MPDLIKKVERVQREVETPVTPKKPVEILKRTTERKEMRFL